MTTLKQERTPEDVCDGCRRGLQVRLDFAGRPEHVHESPDWPWVKLGGSGFSYIETCSARIMETPTMADPTLLERLRELQGKATPPTWALDENKGAGLEIRAHVPHLDRAVKLQHVSLSPKIHVEDGKVFVYVSYESWNQFPSADWKEMQRANAQLIVTLVNALPEILEALEDRERLNWMLAAGDGNPGEFPKLREGIDQCIAEDARLPTQGEGEKEDDRG